MDNTTVYLKAYRPPNFAVLDVHLQFDLYDDHALVSSTFHIQRLHPGPLFLYGDELELLSIHCDEHPLPENAYHKNGADLIINQCPDECTLRVVTRIRPQENTALSGLYRTPNREYSLFCTQCEAQGFRRMTFFPDRPDVLTTYTTRITADKAAYPVLLSNGNLMEAGEDGNGRHWVVWHDPFKKPSYLFALVAGNLACATDTFVTRSGREVLLRIYVEPGNEDHCAHAMDSLKKAMRWDEDTFGREYDLDVYMIVAVSDFNMGAMENKGLNIFNSKYILGRPETATDEDYAGIEAVVGHEYFHNWSGNRVTCRDWFQLSLKEGLTVFREQEFSRDMNSRAVNRIMDVKDLRMTQFPEDAGSMAHPVRPESYQEINNFYTATVYSKGAEIIRMQQTLLGKEGFRRGMDLYFDRNDGKAVTIDDFVAAMEDANGVDLAQFKRWYSQAGTPVVKVLSSFKKNCLTLTLTQSCPPTQDNQVKKPFHIPIRMALFDSNGHEIPLDQPVLELREAQQVFHFPDLPCKPVVSLLRDFSAPVYLHKETRSEELLTLLRCETNGVAKWDAAQQLVLDCLQKAYANDASTWSIAPELLDAYRWVLRDNNLDRGLRAETITPPSFEEVAVTLTFADTGKVEAVRDFYRAELGTQLYADLESMYHTLWEEEDHGMHAVAFGRRKLRNSCLWFMMKAQEEHALPHCQRQWAQAKTMTDQIASLTLLANCHQADLRQAALHDFFQQWENNELVVDKWLRIQACSELPDTLTQVKKLLQHPAFSFTNPNKVRAVIGAFVSSNPRHFHAADGTGYVFLKEMLITLDPINPQVAARLATPFTRGQLVDEPRQRIIQAQLRELAARKLSRDLKEVVEKSLAP